MNSKILELATVVLQDPAGCSPEAYRLFAELLGDELDTLNIEEDEGRYFLRSEAFDDLERHEREDVFDGYGEQDGFEDCPDDPDLESEDSFEGDELDALMPDD